MRHARMIGGGLTGRSPSGRGAAIPGADPLWPGLIRQHPRAL